jgi:hypothetical protein
MQPLTVPTERLDRHRDPHQAPADRIGYDPDLANHFIELIRPERLPATGQCVVRRGMHLDQEAIGAGRNRRTCHRKYLAKNPGSMARVGSDRQV